MILEELSMKTIKIVLVLSAHCNVQHDNKEIKTKKDTKFAYISLNYRLTNENENFTDR